VSWEIAAVGVNDGSGVEERRLGSGDGVSGGVMVVGGGETSAGAEVGLVVGRHAAKALTDTINSRASSRGHAGDRVRICLAPVALFPFLLIRQVTLLPLSEYAPNQIDSVIFILTYRLGSGKYDSGRQTKCV